MKRISSLLLLACAVQAAAQGYRGDGSGVFANAHPPTTWDEKTGDNIRWRAPLAHFGHSTPVVVAGKVFVTSEPGWKAAWPVLQCFAADTGKLLWQAELNHLPATPLSPAEQKELGALWQEFYGRWRAAYHTQAQWMRGEREAAEQKFAELGISSRSKGNWSSEIRANIPADWPKKLAVAGLRGETFREGGGLGTACLGQTYATPVADERAVYVATAFGGFFSFDHAGNLLWVKYYPGNFGEYCRNGRSPLLYKDLLISDITAKVRAMDKRTGELKWSADVDGETIMTPAIITVGGTDVLLCYNKKAFRLPDGQPLTVEGSTDFGATALVKYDERDTVFFTGGGEHGGWQNKGKCETPPPSCVKFALAGDKLTGQVLWSGIDGQPAAQHEGIVYHAGKLYHGRGVILDAATGKILAGSLEKKATGPVPPTRHLLLIANNHVYGIRQAGKTDGSATCSVSTLDGKKVAGTTLSLPAPTGEKLEQIRSTVGRETWMFSYGCPFTIAGDSLYLRSNDELWCIGGK